MAIQVTYRRTSRLSMRIVKNGDVHVSVPYGLPKKMVENFIEEHRDWIEKARKKTSEKQQTRADFFHQLPLETREQKAEALARLKALVESMVERHAEEMGVRPSAVVYKPMVSRWGRCNVRDRSICISSYVLLLPEWCVEHVVVHELCHLLEPSHNARFHALMDRYFPRWREARKEVNRRCRRKRIEVVAAIIHDDEGRIFATQRGYGDYKDGWEFPGGKMEPGESPEEALRREIWEELETRIVVERLVQTVEYEYPKFHLRMHCFWCHVESGSLTLKEHEAARWLSKEQLDSVDWLPADQIVVDQIK